MKTVLIAPDLAASVPAATYADAVSTPDATVDEPTAEPVEGVFDRIWTVPNLFTLVRLLCLPWFLYLLFVDENRAAAAWLLAALGSTDWVDGYIARRFDQGSEFGKIFDPTVDRVLFIVAVTAIIVDGSIPVWFGVAVLVREILVGGVIAFSTLFLHMQRFGVTWLGKCATFLLMGAVPSFLLGAADVWESPFFGALAWVLGIPGLVLSYWTAIAYIPLIRSGLEAGRASTSTRTEGS